TDLYTLRQRLQTFREWSTPCLVERCRDHRGLHSFPTRRSSDLAANVAFGGTLEIDEETGLLFGAPINVVARCFPNSSNFALVTRSEEHTSELQSREKLVCRLLLEKKK